MARRAKLSETRNTFAAFISGDRPRGGSADVGTYAPLTADGGKILALKSVKQVVYQGQHCLMEMVVDLRKVRTAENALNIAEERYRMVFETSPDATIITGTKGICTDNPAFGTSLGYLPEEMKGCFGPDFPGIAGRRGPFLSAEG